MRLASAVFEGFIASWGPNTWVSSKIPSVPYFTKRPGNEIYPEGTAAYNGSTPRMIKGARFRLLRPCVSPSSFSLLTPYSRGCDERVLNRLRSGRSPQVQA